MAKKRRGFFRKARRAGRRFFSRKAKRHSSGDTGSLLTKGMYAAGYGFVRPFAVPYVDTAVNAVGGSALPNNMGRELGLGLVGWAVHKWINKPVGATMLVNESYNLGGKLNNMTVGGSSTTSMYL